MSEPSDSMVTWTGGGVGPDLTCVLAPNPGPLTLEGTNTWIVGAPGSEATVVVDPGPAVESHLAAIENRTGEQGRRIAAIVLTHGHPDHAEGAVELSRRADCEVFTVGHVINVGGIELEVVDTPGHSSDSVSLLVAQSRALITGDTILGRGTAVIAYPDGDLGEYLESLRRLRALAERMRLEVLLPGHGPPLTRPVAAIDGYLRHRAERLEQVRKAVNELGSVPWPDREARARLATDVVELVYSDVPRVLWPAAGASVRAQLAYLFGPEEGQFVDSD